MTLAISSNQPWNAEQSLCKGHKDQSRRGQISECGQTNILEYNKRDNFHSKKPATLRNSL